MEEFCYYIRHGLWDVAEGLLNSAMIEGHDFGVKNPFAHMLFSIAAHPTDKGFPSCILQQPYQQTWMAASCIMALKKESSEAEFCTSEAASLKKQAEFHKLLEQLPGPVPQGILKELLQLYYHVLHAKRLKKGAKCLSVECSNFLHDAFMKKPFLVNMIVQNLLCLWCPYFVESDEQLERICQKVLECAVSSAPTFHKDGKDECCDKYLRYLAHDSQKSLQPTLFLLLTLMRFSGNFKMSKNECVLNCLYTMCDCRTTKTIVYLSFLAQSDVKLLKTYCDLEDQNKFRSTYPGDLTMCESVCSLLSTREFINVEELFLRMLKRDRHWIEDAVMIFSQLLLAGDNKSAIECLSQPTYNNLWILVLLEMWYNSTDKQQIFPSFNQIMKDCESSLKDPTLIHVVRHMARQLRLVEWCMKHRKNSTLSMDFLLNLATKHSDLFILNMVTNLSEVDWRDVYELLQENCDEGDKGQESKPQKTDDAGGLSGWGDVAVFQAFCVLKSAFDAIIASVEVEDLRRKSFSQSPSWMLNGNFCVPDMSVASTSQDEGTSIPGHFVNCDLGGVQNLYKENVIQKLDYIKNTLCKLPLELRIEMLENIFSLLFLRYEDLQDDGLSESGDEDDADRSYVDTSCDVTLSSFDGQRVDEDRLVSDISSDMKTIQEEVEVKSGSFEIKDSLKRMKISLLQSVNQGTPLDKNGLLKEVETKRKLKNVNQGFVCSQFIIRDLLVYLRDCLWGTHADFYSSRAKNVEESVGLNTTASDASLQQRLRKLTQNAGEGTWRLQLITNEQFPKEPGIVTSESLLEKEQEWMYESDESDSEDEMTRTSSSSIKSQVEKVADSRVQSGGAASGYTTSSYYQNTRRNKYFAQQPSISRCGESIINMMLSSESSLCMYCLSQGDLVKANKVVEEFHMQESNIASEISFVDNYQLLKQKLNTFFISNSGTTKKHISDGSTQERKMSSLQSLKKVAADGVSSTSLTSLVETFLSQTMPPVIQETESVMAGFPASRTHLNGCDNGKAMIAVDLALTMGSTYRHSVNLLDIACKFCLELQSTAAHVEALEKSNKMSTGFVNFTRNMIVVLKEVNRRTDGRETETDLSLCNLLNSELPLSLKSLRQNMMFWDGFLSSLKEFLSDMDVEVKPKSQRLEESKEVERYSWAADLPGVRTHLHYRKLMRSCSAMPQLKGGKTKEAPNYLFLLYGYVKIISVLLAKYTSPSKGVFTLSTYFDILEESLVKILGHLIFTCNVPPPILESVSQKIKVSLVHNIVRNCSPIVPNRPVEVSAKYIMENLQNSWGRITLNKKEWTQTVRHPEVAVRSLLTDILGVLQNHLNIKNPLSSVQYSMIQTEDITALRNNLELRAIFEDTGELSLVDLRQLSSSDESLVFFTNLANLMFLHALLSFPGPGIFSFLTAERVVAHKCIGYEVGQLGFVSLFSVKQKILGEEFTSPSPCWRVLYAGDNAGSEKLWSELTISTDPRILFVVTDGFKSSPKVQVLYVENLEEQLEAAVMNYMNHHIRVDFTDSQIKLVIPALLQRYQDYVLQNQEPEGHSQNIPQLAFSNSDIAKEKLLQVLDFLRDNTSGSLQAEVIDCVDQLNSSDTAERKAITVNIENCSQEAGITLEYFLTNRTEPSDRIETDLTDEITWESNVLSEFVLKFLQRHCWLLAFIIQKIHEEKLGAVMLDCALQLPEKHDKRTVCLERLCTSEWVNTLKCMYGNNSIVAALHPQPAFSIVWEWMESSTRIGNWRKCLEILQSLPDAVFLSDAQLQSLRDIVLYELASRVPYTDSPTPWWYCQQIQNFSLQVSCVLNNVTRWTGSGCREALGAVLESYSDEINQDLKANLKEKLDHIEMYEMVLPYCKLPGVSIWQDVQSLSETNPSYILQSLIDAKQFQVCLQWASSHGIPTRIQQLVDSKFVMMLLDPVPADFTPATKLLESLPTQQVITICSCLTEELHSLDGLEFVVDYLLNRCSASLSATEKHCYKLLRSGIHMLYFLPKAEQLLKWELKSQPHLIIEELLMNTRLATLQKILDGMKSELSQLDGSFSVSLKNIDLLLQQYATKALDFCVVQSPAVAVPSPASEEKLLQSLSIDSDESEGFVMPVKIPTKSEWIPDAKVTDCMCCHVISFSMFSRRHHCRRCGRVVCASCSSQRLKVSGYGDVAVRVCTNCYDQTQHQVQVCPLEENQAEVAEEKSSQLEIGDYWRLSEDETHNATMREEFIFEHAPSVSLCLSILKLHSEQVPCSKFLLESCKQMLHILQPVKLGTVNPEVDYNLVIQMVRSLVVAAKVKYAQLGLNMGVDDCDELLRQVDLLSLLVKNGCTALIPSEFLQSHSIRRLRDRLVEEELWELALEVSTKGGFDQMGVWAAWGKACLQAGQWAVAREKFFHCLKQVNAGDAKPSRNPLLLNDIVNILESGMFVVDKKVVQQADKLQLELLQSSKRLQTAGMKDGSERVLQRSTSPALTILHSLASLKSISQGKIPQNAASNKHPGMLTLDMKFYKECQYYLKTYGSSSALLNFYIRHNHLDAALHHVLEQNVDCELFLETIYYQCVKQGAFHVLQKEIKAIDPTLELWKVYLCHVCHHLEQQGLLNLLYQLQLFMHDYVRASMTCIRFYQAEARSYTNLLHNIGHLHEAQKHLQMDLDEFQWGVSKSSGRKLERSSSHISMKLDPRKIDHYINTILQQMEVTKFLSKCEAEGHRVLELLPEISEYWVTAGGTEVAATVPTLFGNSVERVLLAVLVILCGNNVEEGFGMGFRIIQYHHLKSSQVYGLVVKKLVNDGKTSDIKQLASCISSSGLSESSEIIDEVLLMCIQKVGSQQDPKEVTSLIKLISDMGNKISAYIECGWLKSAYLLAAKNGRVADVRRILKEAEGLGQTSIRALCLKWLSEQPPA